MMFQIEIAA